MEMTAIQGDLTEQGRAVRKIDGVTPLGIETVVYGKLWEAYIYLIYRFVEAKHESTGLQKYS